MTRLDERYDRQIDTAKCFRLEIAVVDLMVDTHTKQKPNHENKTS